YNFLHMSEFGYVAAHLPQKADELISGTQETVPDTGIIVMEADNEIAAVQLQVFVNEWGEQ
ncbi:MAG: hypothetical protein II218_01265, partial [Peptococcaceae bacterium]|nr:hypothetical protein [Peptococcaceae bacterium]